jgi:hypothetical protein
MGFINMRKMAKKSKIINAGFLLLGILLAGCTDSSLERALTTTPFDEVGQFELKVERSKKDPSNPMLEEELVTETLLSVNVLTINEESTTLEWRYGKSMILGNQVSKISADEQKAINIYEGIAFDLSVKVNGEILVQNYSAVRGELEALFLKLYGNDSLTAESEMYARVKRMFEIKAGTAELMLENFFPEISLLFSSVNEEFIVGSNLTLDSVANPYGGGYLDILSAITIANEEGEIVISKYDSIPQDVLESKVMDYLNEAYGPAAANIPKAQIPHSTYLINLEVILGDDNKLQSVSTEKQFTQGEKAMVDVLEVRIER